MFQCFNFFGIKKSRWVSKYKEQHGLSCFLVTAISIERELCLLVTYGNSCLENKRYHFYHLYWMICLWADVFFMATGKATYCYKIRILPNVSIQVSAE